MGSIVNQKGGYYTSVDIFRDQKHTSATRFKEPVLKNTKNYICQVQKFVTNITPAINTLDPTIFTIKTKPSTEEEKVDLNALTKTQREADDDPCTISACRSVPELYRQIVEFCEAEDGLEVILGMDYTITFSMSQEFGDDRYIELSDDFSELVGLQKYLSFFYSDSVVAGEEHALTNNPYMNENQFNVWNTAGGYNLDYPGDNEVLHRPAAYPLDAQAVDGHISDHTLSNLDTRVSIDVSLTIPHPSTQEILDGREGRTRLIARFPLKDYKEHRVIATDSPDVFTLRENIFLGCEDLTRGNPDTNSSILFPGEFSHANVMVETRYLENKQFKRVPTDFGNHGFWNLRLLFAKKIK